MAKDQTSSLPPEERLFAGKYPTGILFADRAVEVLGDYKRLGFLPYETLELEVERGCPPALEALMRAHATKLQAQAGQPYPISTAGQTVTLGWGINTTAKP